MAIDAEHLGKSFGSVRAVDDLSFTVPDGVVTGFLGPNGAGKSTAMRLMLGLDRGDGRTLFDGLPLGEHSHPSRVVGTHLDARPFLPGRTARDHLRMLATEARVPASRIDEVLAIVGLTEVANDRPKSFSLGMAQRLGLADHVVVIAGGRLIVDGTIDELVSQRSDVLVRSADSARLMPLLVGAGATVVDEGQTGVAVAGLATDEVGRIAFDAGIAIFELTERRASLEETFMQLTGDGQQFAFGASS